MAPEAPPKVRDPDLRLVIEEDPRTGVFVYKTMNRETGEVVLQLPRDEMLKTMAAGGFGPGDLFKTRV